MMRRKSPHNILLITFCGYSLKVFPMFSLRSKIKYQYFLVEKKNNKTKNALTGAMGDLQVYLL